MKEFITKRRSPRRTLERRVGILHRGSYHAGVSLEVGEGGMLFVSEHAMQVNDQIVVTFSIPGNLLVPTRALVRYEVKNGEHSHVYGLQFAELELHYLRIIRRFVAEKTQDEINREKANVKKFGSSTHFVAAKPIVV
mgnify:CR=1 FL=1